MFDVKIINNNIEDNLSNKNCIYVKLDYDNPIINGKNIAYPILSAWLEKTSIDCVDELKIKMPELPDLDEYSFVNIIYYTNNTYKILILREPIRVINEKININNYINDIFYDLKDNKWIRNSNDISYKSTVEPSKIEIVHSNYNIIDDNGNLFFKKNDLNKFYEFVFNKINNGR